jgi:hypothetical protein
MKPSSSPATRNTAAAADSDSSAHVKSATKIGASAKDCASPNGRQSRILDPGDWYRERTLSFTKINRMERQQAWWETVVRLWSAWLEKIGVDRLPTEW